SGLAIVLLHTTAVEVRHVQVAVGTEEDSLRLAQPVAFGLNEGIDVYPGVPIEALDRVVSLAADVEVAVRAKDDAARGIDGLGEDVDQVPGAVIAQDRILRNIRHVEIAVRAPEHHPGSPAPAREVGQEIAGLLVELQDTVEGVAGDEQV